MRTECERARRSTRSPTVLASTRDELSPLTRRAAERSFGESAKRLKGDAMSETTASAQTVRELAAELESLSDAVARFSARLGGAADLATGDQRAQLLAMLSENAGVWDRIERVPERVRDLAEPRLEGTTRRLDDLAAHVSTIRRTVAAL
jgi:hypothetical protein